MGAVDTFGEQKINKTHQLQKKVLSSFWRYILLSRVKIRRYGTFSVIKLNKYVTNYNLLQSSGNQKVQELYTENFVMYIVTFVNKSVGYLCC